MKTTGEKNKTLLTTCEDKPELLSCIPVSFRISCKCSGSLSRCLGAQVGNVKVCVSASFYRCLTEKKCRGSMVAQWLALTAPGFKVGMSLQCKVSKFSQCFEQVSPRALVSPTTEKHNRLMLPQHSPQLV